MESKLNELVVHADLKIEYSDFVNIKSDDPAIADDAVQVTGYHVVKFMKGEYVGKEEDLEDFDPLTRERLRHEYWGHLQKIIKDAVTKGVLNAADFPDE